MVYTDGSVCGGAAGCGACSAILHPPSSISREASHQIRAVGRTVCIDECEIDGIILGIHMVIDYIRNGLVDVCNATAYILCDALWAIEAIDNTDVCIPPHLFKRLKASCHVLVSSGIHIKLINIPGNSGIEGNVEADKRAKDTAYHIYKGEITAPINVSMKTAFNLSREIATRSWQRMWDNDQSGRYTHNLIPSVNCKILFPLTRDIGIS